MFEEIKKELDEEYNSLADYHNDCYNKIDILRKNTKKHKLELTGALTLCSIIPVFIGMASQLEGIPTSLISMTLFTASVTVVSTAIGYLGQKLITLSSMRKMKNFTKAKKNREIVTQLSHYELEKEKTKNKIDVIAEIYNKIESKEKILKDLTADGKYKVTENNLAKEELSKNYELILQNYNNKIKELDILVSQEFLRKKFRDYRKKSVRLSNAIAGGWTLGLIISFPTCLGFLGDELRKQIPIESASDLIKQVFSTFIPAIATSPITIFSTLRSSSDYLYAFNELNNTLGDNALEEKPNKISEEKIEKNIERLKNELVELGYSLKETEYALKGITTQNNNKEKIVELENTKSNMSIEETVENISQTNTDISWIEPYLEEDIETDEIEAKEEKIPKLVRSLKNKHR